MLNQINKVCIGNRGKDVRSDCYIEMQLTSEGGIELDFKSKVNSMFGIQIKQQISDILSFYDIKNCHLLVEDFGALPLVISARMEAAIKLLIPTIKKCYLPAIINDNKSVTAFDKQRFSRLYLPGNKPSLMINAGLHHPDGIILDLEDAVAPDKKYEARFIVRNSLRALSFYGAERMVRINQIPAGIDDLEFVVSHNVNLILVPKCESAEQIQLLNGKIEEIKKANNLDYSIWLMPIIESALGVVRAFEIASSASNIVAMAIGLEDYTADLGTGRTNEGTESFYARSVVVNACRAAGIQPIDSVFSDIADMDALALNVQKSKALGFDGMGCIHPRQIPVIHKNFAPTASEIDKAKKIVNAFIIAKEQGLGVVSLGTKMIDAPVVKRAHNTLRIALLLGIINDNWRESFVQNNESI